MSFASGLAFNELCSMYFIKPKKISQCHTIVLRNLFEGASVILERKGKLSDRF